MLHSALHPLFQSLGSHANLDVDGMPEAVGGLRIAREWVRHVCHDLSYGPPGPAGRFGQWFTTACMLAFELDGGNARSFVPRKPMYRLMQWPRSLFRGEGEFIGQDLVTFLTAEEHGSLTSGSSYLRYVWRDTWDHVYPSLFSFSEIIRSELRVDLNALCDLAERLSGLLVVAHRAGSWGGVLHNVALPRSWFVNLGLLGADLRRDTSAFSMFVSTMVELMQGIDAQVRRYLTRSTSDAGEKFIVDGRRMTNLTGPVYIARM